MIEPSALAFAITGLLIGVVSGMIGIGGATLLVPALVILFGFSQGRAQGTSIGALVPPIGIFAAIQYYRAGLLDVRAACFVAGGFVFGALAGATFVPYIPQAWLKRVFATVLVYVAAQLVFADPKRRMGAVLPGIIGAAFLWALVGVRQLLGKRAKPAAHASAHLPKGSDDDIDYHI